MEKNKAAYHVNRSAVKKIHFAKRGIATIRQKIPRSATIFSRLRSKTVMSNSKKIISCGFIFSVSIFLQYYFPVSLIIAFKIGNQHKNDQKSYSTDVLTHIDKSLCLEINRCLFLTRHLKTIEISIKFFRHCCFFTCDH